MIHGYDISNVNGPNYQFPEAAEFIIAKVTQDALFIDKEYTRHRDRARHLEIPFGGYHYADLSEQPDPMRSLGLFLSCLGDQQDGEFAALDAEQDFGNGGLVPGDPRNLPWVLSWGRGFTQAKNYKCKLYIGHSAIDDLGLNTPEVAETFDLWYAWWSDNPPPAPAPWQSYSLWQYDSTDIDKDAWLGTADELRATGFKKPEPPAQIDYESTYWTPIMALMNNMIAQPLHRHADLALHAAISNAITLHKITYGVESRD